MRHALLLSLLVLTLAACSRQEAAWRSASSADTATAYETYLREFPGGAHAGDARDRLLAVRERQEWDRAGRLGTPEAFQRYLAAYPDGRFAGAARARLSGFLADPAAPAAAASPDPPAVAGSLPGQADVGSHRIQLGAYTGGEAAARRAWADIATRHADLVGGLLPRVDAVERDGRALWRLQAGPASEQRARELCAALAARGTACVVVRD